MLVRNVIMLSTLALLVLAGCHGGDLDRLLDPDSQQRLAGLPENGRVLVSLRGESQPPQLPELAAPDRTLDRVGNSVLMEVDRQVLPELADTPGLVAGVIWGGDGTLAKLDPALRMEILTALGDPELRSVPLAVIGRFDPAAPGVADQLATCGASVRSTNEGIVTFDGIPDTVLRVLSLPGLIELKRPNMLNPLGS